MNDDNRLTPSHSEQLLGRIHPDILSAFPLAKIDLSQTYHSPLPPQLARWYAYVHDTGHSIMVIPSSRYHPDHDPASQLIAVPVRTALQDDLYDTPTGHLLMELDYQPAQGVPIDDDDYEYLDDE